MVDTDVPDEGNPVENDIPVKNELVNIVETNIDKVHSRTISIKIFTSKDGKWSSR
jgi:hypothetical protein